MTAQEFADLSPTERAKISKAEKLRILEDDSGKKTKPNKDLFFGEVVQ